MGFFNTVAFIFYLVETPVTYRLLYICNSFWYFAGEDPLCETDNKFIAVIVFVIIIIIIIIIIVVIITIDNDNDNDSLLHIFALKMNYNMFTLAIRKTSKIYTF